MSVRNLLCGLGLCLALNAAFASGGSSRGDAVVFDRDFRTEEGDPSLDGFESSKPCTVIRNDGRCLQVRFALAPRECVTFHVAFAADEAAAIRRNLSEHVFDK